MVVLVIFEAVFAYVRQFLIVHLTTRVDVKLGTYMFDKVLNLPIDFFERTQTGKITYDTQPDVEDSCFPDGAAFRDCFGFHHVAGLHTGHVLLQPHYDVDRFGDVRADGALDRCHAAGLSSQDLGGRSRGIRAWRASGADNLRHPDGQVARARCAPASPLGRADGPSREIAICRRHARKSDSSGRAAVGAVCRQRVLRGWRLFGAYDQ